jgi:hypothetical protein
MPKGRADFGCVRAAKIRVQNVDNKLYVRVNNRFEMFYFLLLRVSTHSQGTGLCPSTLRLLLIIITIFQKVAIFQNVQNAPHFV